MDTTIFMGPVFAMRLKHMTEDKWNARAEGRREQKTHQPTGGRGQQGGLRIGEMERDALAGHGITDFLRESVMERADKTQFRICNGCGTVPITNDSQHLVVCPLCDGPVSFIGTNSTNIEILPTAKKSLMTNSVVEMPYATKLLVDELQTYMNMGLRILTAKGLNRLGQPDLDLPPVDEVKAALSRALPDRVLPETRVPEFRVAPVEVEAAEEDLYAMGVVSSESGPEEEEDIEKVFGQPEPLAFADVTPLTSTPSYAPMTPVGTPLTQSQAYTSPEMPQPAQAQPAQVQQAQPAQVQTAQTGGYMQLQPQQLVYMPPMPMQPMQPVPMQPMPMQPMQPMPIQVQNAYTQPIVYSSPIPNGVPTITIPTSPQDMQQGGYLETYQYAAAGNPVMGQRGGRQTPRGRAVSPRRYQTGQTGPPPQTKVTTVTVRKLN
jgi:hypothetical protein